MAALYSLLLKIGNRFDTPRETTGKVFQVYSARILQPVYPRQVDAMAWS